MKRVAFLGLGTMGTEMARRLLRAGFAVNVHNRTRAKADPLVAEGAVWSASPREAASTADVILSMVADDPASRSMWLGHDGALAGAKPGSLAIESSTLSAEWSDELRAAALAAELRFLDAPVAGSQPQAAAGELVFIVGGDANVFEEARPVLSAMGKRLVHVGGPGAGTRVKLINNFLAGVQTASLAEALAFMQRAGMNIEKAMEILLPGAPGSPMIKNIYSRIQGGDENVYFSMRLMAKDLTYAQEAGVRFGVQMRTAAAALAVFQNAVAQGDGERDLSAVTRQFQNLSR